MNGATRFRTGYNKRKFINIIAGTEHIFHEEKDA